MPQRGAGFSRSQIEQLLGGDDQQAERQVCGDLGRASNAHVLSAVVVVEMRKDALGGAALPIADGFGRSELALSAPARIMIDEGDMAA